MIDVFKQDCFHNSNIVQNIKPAQIHRGTNASTLIHRNDDKAQVVWYTRTKTYAQSYTSFIFCTFFTVSTIK